MATPRKPPAGQTGGDDVDALVQRLDHPLKAGIEAVRDVIRRADPAISEGVKWNAPSFRTSEYFATVHVRNRDAVQVILHLGAKARGGRVTIDDPDGLLEWLGADRATVRFRDPADVAARGAAFAAVVRQWIAHLA